MKRWLIYLLLTLQTLFSSCVALAAADSPAIPPRPTAAAGIYVQDYAGVLSAADRQKILSLGQELDNKTTAQLAVLTVKSLNGQPIDNYALDVLRAWGIGRQDKNNGALIVVAVQDRQSRMEIGYGLEGVLNDALTGRIQDQFMLPYFRQGNYAAGIINGYAATATLIARSAGVQLQGSAVYSGGARGASGGEETYPLWLKLVLGVGVIILLIIDNIFLGGFITRILIFSLLRGGRGGGRGFGGGGGGGGGSSRRW